MQIFSLKHLFHKAKGDSFVMDSAVLFAGSLLVGVVNYLYQFLMARMLPVEMYGEVQSLLAILSVIAVFSGAISIVTVKYTADFASKSEWNKVYSLVSVFTKKIFLFSSLGFVFYVLVSGHIAIFLNIPSKIPIIILGLGLVFSFSSSVSFGILRGLQKFREFSFVSIAVAILKVIFSVIFIKLGFAVNGAVGAVVIATILGYCISFYPIKFLRDRQKEPIGGKKILRYSLPVLAALLCTTLLWSVDMIMVKHYFLPQTAGEYAALAMLGHIIFFVVSPIISVMFPKAADAHSSAHFPAKVLKKALIITVPIGLVIVGGFFLLPGLVIKLLVGSKFLSLVPYLGWFGFSMFLYSLVTLFSNYFLSVGETKNVILVGIGSVLQIVLLALFHDTMWQVVIVMNGVMALILALLIVYFVRLYYVCPQK